MEFSFLGISVSINQRDKNCSDTEYGLNCFTSHYLVNGKSKVDYKSMTTAKKAAIEMEKKTGNDFSSYKCSICEGYHIGKD
jgi:hypothetical protein